MGIDFFDVTKQIYLTLSADGTLTGKLGTFNSTTAIFTGTQVPPDTTLPYLWIEPLDNISNWGAKDFAGAEATLDINCVITGGESSKVLLEIVKRVVELLNQASISLTSDTLLRITHTNSFRLPMGDELTGMILTFSLIII